MGQIHISEIKARCADAERVRAYLRAQDADFRGTERQVDTYFRAPQGRLKLREGPREATRIYYERENQREPKTSTVTLSHLPQDSNLKAVLSRALGVLVVVDVVDGLFGVSAEARRDALVERGHLGRVGGREPLAPVVVVLVPHGVDLHVVVAAAMGAVEA